MTTKYASLVYQSKEASQPNKWNKNIGPKEPMKDTRTKRSATYGIPTSGSKGKKTLSAIEFAEIPISHQE